MRTQMIYEDEVNTIQDAYKIAPWAAEIVEVDGGFKAFESAEDAKTWQNQV